MVSVQQGSPFWKHLCEESTSALEMIYLETKICQRKILQERPVEMVAMGNLFLAKLLQFSIPMIACTLNIHSNQSLFGILKHAMNLFPGIIKEKMAMRHAWTLGETGEEPSPVWFDACCTPNPIMNILIWNCRGAMKPTFKKTVMDLVEWHKPAIFVITETRIDGSRANDIIRRLPFDGAYSTETIGHAGGI